MLLYGLQKVFIPWYHKATFFISVFIYEQREIESEIF